MQGRYRNRDNNVAILLILGHQAYAFTLNRPDHVLVDIDQADLVATFSQEGTKEPAYSPTTDNDYLHNNPLSA